jgi:hypothetical protein
LINYHQHEIDSILNAAIKTPTVATSDFIYLRLIGDRSIDEKDFGKIQKID